MGNDKFKNRSVTGESGNWLHIFIATWGYNLKTADLSYQWKLVEL